nr:MAG TPA: hypothetical protein [Caudoviricetes sp.]
MWYNVRSNEKGLSTIIMLPLSFLFSSEFANCHVCLSFIVQALFTI